MISSGASKATNLNLIFICFLTRLKISIYFCAKFLREPKLSSNSFFTWSLNFENLGRKKIIWLLWKFIFLGTFSSVTIFFWKKLDKMKFFSPQKFFSWKKLDQFSILWNFISLEIWKFEISPQKIEQRKLISLHIHWRKHHNYNLSTKIS